MQISSRLLLLAVLGMHGCAWLIPDREKEYLSVQPLPPLKLPPDLLETHPPSLEEIKPPAAIPSKAPSVPLTGVTDTSAPYIDLPHPFPRAWSKVLKALNQQAVEITEMDADRGLIDIIHSSTGQELGQDQGLWEDLLYFFTGKGKLHERAYQLLLVPVADHTRLFILDEKGDPVDDPQSLQLLQDLKKTLASRNDS